MLQNNLSNFSFNENVKMLKKGPFMVESFVTNGSFDNDFTPLP
jgi:hypothetical protein